jgi:hypothetical protein
MWPETENDRRDREDLMKAAAIGAPTMTAETVSEMMTQMRVKNADDEPKPVMVGMNKHDDHEGPISGAPVYLPSAGEPKHLDHGWHNEDHRVIGGWFRMMQRDMQKLLTSQTRLEEAERKRAEAWTRLSRTLELETKALNEWAQEHRNGGTSAEEIMKKLDDALIQIEDIYEILEEME